MTEHDLNKLKQDVTDELWMMLWVDDPDRSKEPGVFDEVEILRTLREMLQVLRTFGGPPSCPELVRDLRAAAFAAQKARQQKAA